MAKRRTYMTEENVIAVAHTLYIMGQGTSGDVRNELKKTKKIDLTEHQVRQLIERLRKGGKASINYSQEDGETVELFSAQRIDFSRAPPTITLTDLVESPDAKALVDEIFGKAGSGGGGGGIRDYKIYELEFVNTKPILGTNQNTKGSEFPQLLSRDWDGDAVVISSGMFIGWFKNNLRKVGVAPSKAKYMEFEDGAVELSGDLMTIERPVFHNGRGAGMKKYEAIPVGSKIKVRGTIPTKGPGIDIDKILSIREFPILSGFGAYNTEFGKVEVRKFVEAA